MMKQLTCLLAIGVWMTSFAAHSGCTITENANGIFIFDNMFNINKSVDGVSIESDGTIIYLTDQIYARSAGNIKDPYGEYYLKLLLESLNNRDLAIWIGYPRDYKNCEGSYKKEGYEDRAKPIYLRLKRSRGH